MTTFISESIHESIDPATGIKQYVVRWTWDKAIGVKQVSPKYKNVVLNEIRRAMADAFAKTAADVDVRHPPKAVTGCSKSTRGVLP